MRVTSTGLVTDQAIDLVTRRLTKLYSVEATHDVFGKADRHSTIPISTVDKDNRIARYGQIWHDVCMKTTINLDDGLVREAMALHRGKTKTAVLELGLQELINADRRRRLGEAFGSQPDLVPVARRRAAPGPS